MVRITLYDPKISAEVYSQRRAAERSLESPVAEGLGRLGRALMAREDRVEPGNQDRTQALRALAKMRKQELSRLREDLKPGSADPHGSGKRFLQEHTKRRDAFLRALSERNPRSAKLVADRAAALTEDVARRATVFEAANIGAALAADINAALIDAVDTVRADPTQRQAMQDEFRATLTALAEEGVDEGAVATLIATADRKIANAAFEGRVDEDAAAAREELVAGEFGDALPAEEFEARLTKVDREVKVRQRRAESAARSTEDAFVAEFKGYQRHLLDGGPADEEAFGDEVIRARVSPETADRLIRERDRAEARGRAFQEIEFLSEEEIEARLAGAEPDEVRHLLWARRHRRQLIGQGSASFVLRDPVVREAFDRWQQARAEGDQAAASAAGGAWANAARALQTRMGIPGSEQRILTTEIAAEMVREAESPEGLDAAALGTMLREQFGGNWRVALADLERAGLSEQVALIAALERPDQQPAARQLSEAVGTPTSALRDAAGEAAAAIDQMLGITLGGATPPAGLDSTGVDTSRAELVRRRAYALAAQGLAPNSAVQRAFEELSTADTSATTGLGGLSLPTLAESQGIPPSALGVGGIRVENILMRFTRFYDLSDEERDALKDDIGRLRGRHEGYSALRDRFVELENSSGFFAAASKTEAVQQPSIPALDLHYRQYIARNLDRDPIARSNAFLRIGSLLLESDRAGEENREWINAALTGDDVRRQEFAADYLAHIGRMTGFDIGDVLSEQALEGYRAFALADYESSGRFDAGGPRLSDIRLGEAAQYAATEGGLGIPQELAASILVDISRSISADEDQRDALIRYIARVVTPFDQLAGLRLQEAVVALNVGPDRVSEIPGRFAAFLSDEQLIRAAIGRGLNRLNYSSRPRRPAGLDGVDRLIGRGGVGLGVIGLATASGPGLFVAAGLGLVASATGYAMAIDDANDEHNDYLIRMEIYHRFQNPQIRAEISVIEDALWKEVDGGTQDDDDQAAPILMQ